MTVLRYYHNYAMFVLLSEGSVEDAVVRRQPVKNVNFWEEIVKMFI